MDFRGWVRTSLIDFPEHIATVFFTAGCNFRCPMCHNAELVLQPGSLPALEASTVWEFLTRRAGKITGVVITGGEPTLQPDLAPFLRKVRDLGYAVKLDTNGYRPDVVANLLASGLVDYVALDVKAPPEKYPLLAGLAEMDASRIARTVSLLCDAGLPFETRTTVVPGLLDADDIEAIARGLAELAHSARPANNARPANIARPANVARPRYVLQQFRGLHTLDPDLAHVAPYPVAELQAMADRARRWLDDVTLRGV